MIDFEYAAPTQLDEAIRLLAAAGDGTRILAGGTDIIVQLREGLRSADLVVDIKKISELTQLKLSGDKGLHLGASVSCRRIYDDQNIAASYPGLADAVRIIGGWQIQSRASVGGNLCNSSPAADAIPPLISYSAQAHIAGPGGKRMVPVEEFCTAPGHNILQQGELLVALTLPPQPFERRISLSKIHSPQRNGHRRCRGCFMGSAGQERRTDRTGTDRAVGRRAHTGVRC